MRYVFLVIILLGVAVGASAIPRVDRGMRIFKNLPNLEGTAALSIGSIEVSYVRRHSSMFSVLVMSGSCSRRTYEEFRSFYKLDQFTGSDAGEFLELDFFLNGESDKGIFKGFSPKSVLSVDKFSSRNAMRFAWDPQTERFSGVIIGEVGKELAPTAP